ncbi:MAG: GntR family transcriptional regulator [Pseudonocardiales bacterium]|jgi:GntR family transcriptional regulator|uniref:GntR family transcriptional regulator n=1 Tax=Pseudonocardia sp. Cha107L01 TaxID=3457576 RepID=UPI0028C88509|nr:GntR family transcriptional regulator [Pseudonocardiales bacterium]MDT7623841.1 GntR family transcriptional regulator [Pseudonocardiales bacterium]MDT7629201.1 GntR family transcriptional regulator [Pseudonocardiales bacterium]MDT7670897.1 GntR family transcriptional regulator [Pseudonocardiales bacterium]MDT7681398.1 GntR family transcriptional regulator [Pseudonocardiales bacterium]
MPVGNSRLEQVRDGLLTDLLEGAAPAGSKLPNEQLLAERFQVSRATVREAVGALVEGGYLVRRHGSGTYVTSLPTRQHALDATLSYTRMIREAGMRPGLRVLSQQTRPATEEESAELNLSPGEALREVERIRTADDRPVVYSLDRISEVLLTDVPAPALTTPLYELLASVGSPVRTATAVLTPVIANARLAKLLGVSRGAPLQRIEETDYSEVGAPVMRSSEWHVPGIFELRVNRRS